MTPFEVYQTYLSLKNHFNVKNFDATKYVLKTNASVDSFNKRKDKLSFEKLAKHEDVKNLLISNFIEDTKSWIREISYNENAKKIYEDWLKRKQSLMYHFENDLSKLNEDFNSNFVTKQGEHPLIIRLYLGGGICLETLVILCDMVGCINHWNKELKDDFIWQELENKITKYKPFLHYDKEKVRNICLTNFDL
jgi:hypothetical protein